MAFDYKMCRKCGECQTSWWSVFGIQTGWSVTTFDSMMRVIESRKNDKAKDESEQAESRRKALEYVGQQL